VTARLKTVGNPWGNAPLTVHFDAGESSLPAGHAAQYEWDLDGDGEFDDGTDSPSEQFQYTDGTKNVEVAVRVKDLETENSSIGSMTVYPGDAPPQVTIAEPAPGLTWGVGMPIRFKGSAEGREQKGAVPLPAADLNWKARLLHCPIEASSCHEHPIQEFSGVAEGTVGAPDHSYPAYINFLLSATDARGLSNETSVKLAARPVAMRIRSEPPGVEIGIGESKLTTPAEYVAIEGSRTSVAAPQEAVVDGTRYTFRSWSDGGARVHDLPATVPGTYTATYAAESGPPQAGGGSGGGGASQGGGGGDGGGPATPSPPVRPKLTGHPAKRTHATTARFVFGAFAGAKFSCKLDRGKLVACRSPLTYRRLKSGNHTVRIYATDGAAGRSAAAVFSWRIIPRA
jgi:hypothetical protein